MGKGKRNREAKKNRKSYSGLSDHKQTGKRLDPPLLTIPNMNLSSWIDRRLPESLWCALLVTRDRDIALEVFRRVAKLVEGKFASNAPVDVTHSGISRLGEEQAAAVISEICSAPGAREALRPLLLFESLPARDLWSVHIGLQPAIEDWDVLRLTVARVLNHQSQEATDCRWLRVLVMLVSGQLHLQTEEQVRSIVGYPHEGDQRLVRPFIRAGEIGLANAPEAVNDPWGGQFWSQCWRDTDCIVARQIPTAGAVEPPPTTEQIDKVSAELAQHFIRTAQGTSVDPKHEGMFGVAAYALAILRELVENDAKQVMARLGLRALLEMRVTLAFLRTRNSPDLWAEYRAYGAGQAKLAFLKLDDEEARKVGFVDAQALSEIANEDKSVEFVPIHLGNWEGSNLRSMSTEGGVKAEYDRFYPWTSAYMHANWGAVRSVSFDTCINALHRVHRILRDRAADLNPVVADACEITDSILDMLDAEYPRFTARVVPLPIREAPPS